MLRVRPNSRRQLLLGAGALAGGLAWLDRSQAAVNPQRIVSVGGALTETLCLLGAQGQLVGVDTTSLFPPDVRRLPSVGYARALSAEGLMSLAPTLIVASDEAGPPTVLRQLEAARLPLQILKSDHQFEGVLERTRRLAELAGRPKEGQTLLARLQQQWQQACEQVARSKAARPPRVLFVLSHALNQVRVAGRKTAADAMLGYAGAINVMDRFEGYRPLSGEAVIAAAPDVLLVTDMGLEAVGGVEAFLRMPGLAQTPAGAKKRVVSMDPSLLLGFGPRLPQAVMRLHELLHG
ncbi:MAG: ABC transporter substrate-binding protein [Burkholderiaceae bacterium]|nr:ABC transporter substrate-binding protein [Burkholderiaceae bacterium]